MKTIHLSYILAAALCFIFQTYVLCRDNDSTFLPGPPPVNMHPVNEDEKRWGIGHSFITLAYDWEEAFWSKKAEDTGDIMYTVNNITFGMLQSRKGLSSIEYGFALGIIRMEENDDTYYSSQRGKNIKASCDGSGYDLGFRLIMSRNFHRSAAEDGTSIVDWNYALSLHTALYYTEAQYSARSFDMLDESAYSEWEGGLFLRPVAALQPMIHLHRNVILIPFLGTGCCLSLYYNYWENDEFMLDGIDSDWYNEGDETGLELFDFKVYYGFDIGFTFSESKKHELTLGGSINRMIGGDGERFSELHIMYAVAY